MTVDKKKIKVLAVGQIPPPYVGQFIMIEKLMNASYSDIEVIPLRMAFSSEVDEIGVVSWKKMTHLISVVIRILYAKLKHRPNVLYYPPAGADMVPIYRDMVILLSTRFLFEKVVFHFHAGGISKIYRNLSVCKQWLFRKAYFGSDLTIRLASENPQDGYDLQTKRDVVIPYGIADEYWRPVQKALPSLLKPELLFLGMLREEKGLFVFLEACKLLHDAGVKFTANLVGGFVSQYEETSAISFVAKYNLGEVVRFSGVLKGKKKWDVYSAADIFCMPSHYEVETFGLVAIEAMQFCLPVVATKWRGLQSIVKDGETGLLVPVKNSLLLSSSLQFLIENPIKREEMGKLGRKRYLECYTESKFSSSFEKSVIELYP